MSITLSRRQALAAAGAALTTQAIATPGHVALAKQTNTPNDADSWKSIGFCLNMSTIRGQNLSVPQQVDVAAKAGYQAIEPWIGDLRKYTDGGGSLPDLRKQIADAGLVVASAIGFAEWIVDDDAKRKAGLENARRDLELVRDIGGLRLAAPPVGATKQSDLNLFRAAERYRALLDVGRDVGVVPQLELWGHSQSISRLGELMFVAVESGHPDACILLDVYHIFKGGSDFTGLQLINGSRVHVFHVNDYPAAPERTAMSDADRVYPGDGIAPLTNILRTVHANGFRGMLSLELFNREYWKLDALEVAKRGLEKTKAAVHAAFA